MTEPRAHLHRLLQPTRLLVWPTFQQTTEEGIADFEVAWRFFGGVFPVAIPDNMGSIVIRAENTGRVSTMTSWSTTQSRGFIVDAASVATPDRQTSRRTDGALPGTQRLDQPHLRSTPRQSRSEAMY